jgi:phospholipase/lecithinase/hemolysin
MRPFKASTFWNDFTGESVLSDLPAIDELGSCRIQEVIISTDLEIVAVDDSMGLKIKAVPNRHHPRDCTGSTGVRAHWKISLVFAMSLIVASTCLAQRPAGIGVIGDSYSDEYRFYPPHRTHARNWVEILAETRSLNFGRYSLSDRGEPRNQGYAYNWARSDSTTEDMITLGQHTGLAEQVARGELDLAFIFIGGNDFIYAMQSADPHSAMRDLAPRASANLRLAVGTLLAARSDLKLVLATVPDIRHLPEFRTALAHGKINRELLNDCTAAIQYYNGEIRNMVAKQPEQFALLDLYVTTEAANFLSRDRVLIAGRAIDRTTPSDEPSHFFLADVRHAGTVGHGMLASMFIDLLNTHYGAGIRRLEEPEILRLASLSPQENSVAASPVLRVLRIDGRQPRSIQDPTP